MNQSLIISVCLVFFVIPMAANAAPAPGAMGGGQGGGMGMGGGQATSTPAECDAALVITPTQALAFGNISAPAAGTVTIDTGGVRTSAGGVVLIAGGTESAASFTTTTAPASCRNLTLITVDVASPATLNYNGFSMSINNFTVRPAAGSNYNPNRVFNVGGTLNVNANQQPGTYSGTIQILITFQ